MDIRYIRITLSPADGSFHAVDEAIQAAAGIHREQLAYVDLLQDDTILALYRLVGPETPDVRDGDFLDHDTIRSSRVATQGAATFVFFHLEPAEPLRTLLAIADEHALLVEQPIEITDDGSKRVTVAGTEPALRSAIAAVPPPVDITIEQVGDYSPVPHGDSLLTDRQHEALAVAAQLGYYEMPREATYEDIATALGCTTSTANDLVRRAEAQLVATYLEGW